MASRRYTLLVLAFERGWNWLNTASTTVRHNCLWLRLPTNTTFRYLFTASSWLLRLRTEWDEHGLGCGQTRQHGLYYCSSQLFVVAVADKHDHKHDLLLSFDGFVVHTILSVLNAEWDQHGLYGSSQLFVVGCLFRKTRPLKFVVVESDHEGAHILVLTEHGFVLVERGVVLVERGIC